MKRNDLARFHTRTLALALGMMSGFLTKAGIAKKTAPKSPGVRNKAQEEARRVRQGKSLNFHNDGRTS